jgi:hypothetical protein
VGSTIARPPLKRISVRTMNRAARPIIDLHQLRWFPQTRKIIVADVMGRLLNSG